MRQWTYLEMKTKVQNDLDLQDELFISSAEFLGYFNEAIDNAEAQIHTLYEDYFLTSANIAFVNGTATVALPSDIYANKIRTIYYVNGQTKYEIKRWRRPLSRIPFVADGEDYEYLPINTSASGYQLKFFPTPAETSSTNVTMWYIRNAKVMALDADICDIPEFINYILQFVKQRCYEKEGHVNTIKAIEDTQREMKLMIDTLTNMVDDEDNQIRKDFSFYDDFDSNITL